MQRLGRLDGLRGVLAVYVMLGHAAPFTVLPAWATGWLSHGQAAVDLFFCLSGLVVINSLERFRYRAAPFFLARARRLLPVYWFVLCVGVLVIAWGSPLASMPWVKPGSAARSDFWEIGLPRAFWWHFGAHVLLLQGVVPGGVLPWVYVTLLGPAWSLSAEWQFYGVMAAVMRPGRRLVWFAGALAGLAVLYRAGSGWLPEGWRFSRAFLPDAAGYFALGLASAVWLRDRDFAPLAGVFLVAVGLGVWSGEPARGWIAAAWLVVLAAQFSDRVPVLPWLLDRPVVRFLGVVSYPLYLVNEPVQRAAAMLMAPLVHGDAAVFTAVWLPVAVAGPVAAAVGLHRWVEVPFAATKAGVALFKRKTLPHGTHNPH
jgi:peptidoglycan/LPS O-acetylase OafA/YrhL